MDYQRIGASGLRVSRLALGTWMTFGEGVSDRDAVDLVARARDLGINHIDTAEAYAMGRAEEVVALALRGTGWDRESVVLASKLYWGLRDEVNWTGTLNRKYLLRSVDGCLRRLDTDYLDILYCHRPDPETPLSEVVWAMSDIVASGKALYWGTSEWDADTIRQACAFAADQRLRPPIVEQPEFNLTWKRPLREECAPLRAETGLGLITWSPLASGMLSGKYVDAVPRDSRASLPSMDWLLPRLTDTRAVDPLRTLVSLAGDLGTTAATLSIAWCLRDPAVDSVLLGARTTDQLLENAGALEVAARLGTDELSLLDGLFEADLERTE